MTGICVCAGAMLNYIIVAILLLLKHTYWCLEASLMIQCIITEINQTNLT